MSKTFPLELWGTKMDKIQVSGGRDSNTYLLCTGTHGKRETESGDWFTVAMVPDFILLSCCALVMSLRFPSIQSLCYMH